MESAQAAPLAGRGHRQAGPGVEGAVAPALGVSRGDVPADEDLEGVERPAKEAKLDRIEEVISKFPDRVFAFDEFGPLAIHPVGGCCWAALKSRSGCGWTITNAAGSVSSTPATRSATTGCGGWSQITGMYFSAEQIRDQALYLATLMPSPIPRC